MESDDEPGGQRGATSAEYEPLGANLRGNPEHRSKVDSQPLSIDERFPAVGRGLWSHVPEADWNDWRWQLRNRITTLEALQALVALTPEEREGVSMAGRHLAMAITPYFFNLIDVNDPYCPIRRQMIPRAGSGSPAFYW